MKSFALMVVLGASVIGDTKAVKVVSWDKLLSLV